MVSLIFSWNLELWESVGFVLFLFDIGIKAMSSGKIWKMELNTWNHNSLLLQFFILSSSTVLL